MQRLPWKWVQSSEALVLSSSSPPIFPPERWRSPSHRPQATRWSFLTEGLAACLHTLGLLAALTEAGTPAVDPTLGASGIHNNNNDSRREDQMQTARRREGEITRLPDVEHPRSMHFGLTTRPRSAHAERSRRECARAGSSDGER